MTERLFGPYRLEQRIGRGGMGEVYRAFDTRRHRTVALKILRSELGDDEEFRERFRREAYVAARLQEPHVVPIHDFGEIDGTLYIDMRLVPGQDLAALLATRGPMPLEQAVALLTQIADALDAAHRDGVVHRDVKPSNILVTPPGFAYLVDFGIARAMAEGSAELTATGATLGSAQYMAPELFEGSRVDAAADVYALACVLFELVTGAAPFHGSPLALLRAHLTAEPPRATAMRPGLPPGVDEVIARGMAKQPHQRFATAGELVRAVALSTSGAPPTATVRAGGPARHPGLVLAAVGTVAALAVTATLLTTSARGTAPDPPLPGPTTATAAPTATPTETPKPTTTTGVATAAELDLIDAVDPAILGGCRPSTPRTYAGLVASIGCTNPEVQPRTRTALLRFASAADLDAYLALESDGATNGAAGYDQNCIAAALIDVWDRGRVVCRPDFTETTQLRIVWTFDDELVVAHARGDAADFYAWWQLNRSLLR